MLSHTRLEFMFIHFILSFLILHDVICEREGTLRIVTGFAFDLHLPKWPQCFVSTVCPFISLQSRQFCESEYQPLWFSFNFPFTVIKLDHSILYPKAIRESIWRALIYPCVVIFSRQSIDTIRSTDITGICLNWIIRGLQIIDFRHMTLCIMLLRKSKYLYFPLN